MTDREFTKILTAEIDVDFNEAATDESRSCSRLPVASSVRFHGAEIKQMAAGADDELNAIAIELFQKIFEHGNYGAFGLAAC